MISRASESLGPIRRQYGSEAQGIGARLLSTVSGFGVAFLATIVAIVIVGVMRMHSERGGRRRDYRLQGSRGLDEAAPGIVYRPGTQPTLKPTA